MAGATRSARAWAAGLTLTAAMALMPAASASAGGVADNRGQSVDTGASVARVNRCTLYASSTRFGAKCAAGASARARTWRQKLAGRPLVTCHHEPVPDGVELPPAPSGGPGTYYLQMCIADFDVDRVGGGDDAHLETELVWIPAGQRVHDIPPWMTWLWASFTATYPTPLLTTGPTAYPRVNVPTYFWLVPETAAPVTREFFDGKQDITMTAELVSLEVRPGVAADEPPVLCGGGTDVYDTRLSPYAQVSTCTHTYLRSSAAMPGEAYPAQASAFWQVGYTVGDGTYRQLGLFNVSTVQLLPVQEVQAVVQP